MQPGGAQDHARRRAAASIINISSPQGKKGKLLRGPYSAAKFGVEGLTQVLALENAPLQHRANCLDPGGIVATEAIRNIPGNRGVRMLSPAIVRACVFTWLGMSREASPDDLLSLPIGIGSKVLKFPT